LAGVCKEKPLQIRHFRIYSQFKEFRVESYYDRLGDMLRDRLASDDDPFDAWSPGTEKRRQAGNTNERVPHTKKKTVPPRTDVPQKIVDDYRILGIVPGSAADQCKAGWKKMLKKHHPDMHASSVTELEQATLMTRKLNESYARVIRWLETGKVT
jgi:DnaJ-domain-containing protein 1